MSRNTGTAEPEASAKDSKKGPISAKALIASAKTKTTYIKLVAV